MSILIKEKPHRGAMQLKDQTVSVSYEVSAAAEATSSAVSYASIICLSISARNSEFIG